MKLSAVAISLLFFCLGFGAEFALAGSKVVKSGDHANLQRRGVAQGNPASSQNAPQKSRKIMGSNNGQASGTAGTNMFRR